MTNFNRRKFLGTSTAVAAGLAFPYIAPVRGNNKKLNLVVIGIGGRGRKDIGLAREVADIIGLCDANWDNRSMKVFKDNPEAKRYKDYKKMFDELEDRIDGVIIATPDHWHYHLAKYAMERGKHVYVEKPLTHSIWESRELMKLANKTGLVTQMGNQGHTYAGTRLIREWLEEGVIGDVKEVHCWTNRPTKWGLDAGKNRPKEVDEIPSTLDWDLWLGPAPERPFNEAYLPSKWRTWWDFGTGALGDMGCHILDASFWALQLGIPDSIEADTTKFNDETIPQKSTIEYRFPSRVGLPAVKLTWFDGARIPPRPKHLEKNRKWPPEDHSGQLYIGSKASIVSDTYAKTARIIPESKMREVLRKKIPQKYPRISHGSPQKEWVQAIQDKTQPGSSFKYSTALTEMVLLGNLAIRSKKKVRWKADEMRDPKNSSADKYIRREYRKV